MRISKCYRLDQKSINLLAKQYNVLDYHLKLSNDLNKLFPKDSFNHLSKFELHQILNKTLLENHHGELVLKYKLFKQFINKKRIIAAFEMKVNNSRLDFLTINGHSTSFEIKSQLDNLLKLDKQISDYILAFDYNYLIVDECHLEKVKKIAPDSFGLWTYGNGKYSKLKNATLNKEIKPEFQLDLLTKNELIQSFPRFNGSKKEILKNLESDEINTRFKRTLKTRYRSRWQFLVNNSSQIMPMDVQFFFNTNVQPLYIYNG